MLNLPQDAVDQTMAIMAQGFDPAFGEAWNRGQLENALMMGHTQLRLISTNGAYLRPQDDATGLQPAGFALIKRVLDEAELLLFAVHPQHRRRGLGARLLQSALAELKNSAISTITLEMRRDNPAEILYKKFGFVAVGQRPKYYRYADGTMGDAITFCCQL